MRAFDRIALIEALDRDAASHALGQVKRALQLEGLPADFGADVYDLAFVFPGADAGRAASPSPYRLGRCERLEAIGHRTPE